VTGERFWTIEFTWTADCTLSEANFAAEIRDPQGANSTIARSRIETAATVDAEGHRGVVLLTVPRDIPAGKFDGVLEVGNGTSGRGQANFSISHQEPLTNHNMDGRHQVIWSIIWLSIGIALLAAARVPVLRRARQALQPTPPTGDATAVTTERTSQDFTTPPGAMFVALGAYPIMVHLLGYKTVAMPAWPFWFGVAALFGGFLIAAVKHRAGGSSLIGGYPFAAAIVLSFGAGIAVWRAQYLNTPDWALSMESTLALMGLVGGATATSALLLLQPDKDAAVAKAAADKEAADNAAAAKKAAQEKADADKAALEKGAAEVKAALEKKKELEKKELEKKELEKREAEEAKAKAEAAAEAEAEAEAAAAEIAVAAVPAADGEAEDAEAATEPDGKAALRRGVLAVAREMGKAMGEAAVTTTVAAVMTAVSNASDATAQEGATETATPTAAEAAASAAAAARQAADAALAAAAAAQLAAEAAAKAGAAAERAAEAAGPPQ